MYCTNCGKEVEENDKFCKNCGTLIQAKNMEVNGEQTKEECSKKYGMKYFKFFSKYYMGFIIILGIISIITRMTTLGNYEHIDSLVAFIAVAELILTVVLYIIVPIKLTQELPQKTKRSFYILIGFIIIDYIWRIISASVNIYFNLTTSNVLETVLAAILFYAVWYIPNLIYFVKRRKLFVN